MAYLNRISNMQQVNQHKCGNIFWCYNKAFINLLDPHLETFLSSSDGNTSWSETGAEGQKIEYDSISEQKQDLISEQKQARKFTKFGYQYQCTRKPTTDPFASTDKPNWKI